MIFEQYILPPLLEPHLEAVFYFKDPVLAHSIERVVPTGHLFILFELDGIVRHTFDNETLKPNRSYTRAWVSGMHRRSISISAHEHSEMLVLQFKPAGAYPFLPFPVHTLNEQILPAEEIFGEEILKLREEIIEAKDLLGKFGRVEKWLLSKFNQENEPPANFLDFLSRLQKEPVSNLLSLVESYPYTQKQLILNFKKYVGLTPKYYQRILRFNELLQKIHQKEQISWADIAYQCGYSDQSHFIKEFSFFSGFNPQEFIKKEFNKEDTNFFPLDRKG